MRKEMGKNEIYFFIECFFIKVENRKGKKRNKIM